MILIPMPFFFCLFFVLFFFLLRVCVCFVFFSFSLLVSEDGRGRERSKLSVRSFPVAMHSRLNPIFVGFDENVELINMYQNFKALEVLNLDSYP